MGLSAGEVVGTGYEGVFARRRMSDDQRVRIMRLLDPFKDLLAVKQRNGAAASDTTVEKIYNTDFSHFPPSQQALLLFLRAIVARPPLLILDEASQGMDEESWARCRTLLEAEWAEMRGNEPQAVVVVSHWEEEVSLIRDRRISEAENVLRRYRGSLDRVRCCVCTRARLYLKSRRGVDTKACISWHISSAVPSTYSAHTPCLPRKFQQISTIFSHQRCNTKTKPRRAASY